MDESEYVPTTEEVEATYGLGWFAEDDDEVKGDPKNFRRWLAQHNAEVARAAKVEVADLLDTLYDEMGEPNLVWVQGIQSAKRAILASIEEDE